MKGGVLLLVLIGLAHFGPEVAARIAGGTVAAWDYVLQGVQSTAVWALVFGMSTHWLARSAGALGVFEAIQRPVCRSMFDMGRPPGTGGLPLCEAAFGAPVSWLGVVCALFVALLAQEAGRAESR